MTKEKYKVVLETVGKKYTKEGRTIEEALSALPMTWNTIKGKGMVTVSKGGHKYEHLFYTGVLRRIFANKLTCAMWAKRLELLLKETK